MLGWGEVARKAHGLTARARDVATTKLGYFTDNGAMLYGDAWGHNLDCCNETVMHGVLHGLHAAHVPIHWIQVSWCTCACLDVCTCVCARAHA